MRFQGRDRLPGLIVAGVAAGLAPVAAPAAVAGDLTIKPSIEARQIFSNNIDLETDAQKQSALVTEIVPGVSMRSKARRLTGALDAYPIVRYQSAGDDKGYNLAGDLAGFGTLEIAERALFVDAQASISQQVLNNRDVASTGNENDVYTYRISPYARSRFGGAAQGELRYLFSQVEIPGASGTGGTAVASNTTTHRLRASLESPNLSSRLKWSVFAMGEEETRSDASDITRREVGGEADYAVTRWIGLIVGAGYQTFDDGISQNKVDDPTWKAGVRLTPGPRTELRATVGERDGGSNAALDFHYKITQRTKLTVTYSKILETSQERLGRTLSTIDVNKENNDLIDRKTELAFNPNTSPFSIDDQTTRTQTVRLGLQGVRGRNSFSVNASWARQEVRPSGATDTIIPVSVQFLRRLSTRTTLNLTAGYERSDYDDGQLDNEYSGSAGLTYRLSPTVQAGSTYSYRFQKSNVATSEFAEHRILFNVKKNF